MSHTDISTNALLSAALAYAERGWHVFPLAPNSKKPLLPESWPEIATDNLWQIYEWWRDCPNANVGIVAGDNLTIIDVDRKNGHDGWAAIGDLINPDTFWTFTPNKGYHFYYQGDGRDCSATGRDGVDLQVGNKYVVAPPSRLPEGPYLVGNTSEPLPLPEPLHAQLAAPRPAVEDTDMPLLLESPPPLPLERLTGQDWMFLAGEIPPGLRSEPAMGLLNHLYQAGMTDEQVLSGVWSMPRAQEYYMEKRQGDYERGLALLWDDCKKARSQRRMTPQEAFSPVEGVVVDPTEADYVLWTERELARRRAARGTSAPAPGGEFTSFADISFEGGPEWLIDGLIPEQGIGQLFGDASQGKSFIAIDQACSVATGRAFHGREVSEPGLAVYLAGEGEDALKYRIEAWRRHHGVEREALRSLVLHGLLDFTDKTKDEQIGLDPLFDLLYRAAFKAGRLPSIIFLDTQSTFLGGSDSDDKIMNQYLRRMRELSLHFGCAVISVTHVGHMEKQRARGHSSQGGDIDFSYSVAEVSGQSAVEKKITELTVGKPYKDGEPAELTAFQWNRVELTGVPPDRKGRTRTSLVFTVIEGYESRAGKRESQEQLRTLRKIRELMARFTQESVSVGMLKEALKSEEQAGGSFLHNFKRHLRDLEKNKKLVIDGDVVTLLEFAPIASPGFQPV